MEVRQLACAAFVLAAMPCRGAERSVVWQTPGTITLNDWIWGAGGEAKAPKPPFEFLDEDFHGTNPKIRVRDGKGDRWTVKFGAENHGDVFASRLLHAIGYLTEPSYYVASGAVSGAHDLKRAKPFIAKDGAFHSARFKLHEPENRPKAGLKTWSWTDNPFAGTPQGKGLKILMMLTSNWDAKDARDGKDNNTSIYSKPGAEPDVRFYAFDDWGATMGKWGGFFGRDKWDPQGYQEQTKTFARSGPGGRIEWGYRGKHGEDIVSGISVDDVRWLLTYLSPVTDEDLRAGLRSSGATEAEIQIFTGSIRERITQLQRLAGLAAPATASAKGAMQ